MVIWTSFRLSKVERRISMSDFAKRYRKNDSYIIESILNNYIVTHKMVLMYETLFDSKDIKKIGRIN